MASALATLLGVCAADAVGATGWVTGARFQKRLARRVDVVWSGGSLRQALQGLSDAQGVAVLIDRRVDPGQKVELQLDDVPLRTALYEVARNRELGVSLLSSVAYFGPPEVAKRLRTIAALRREELRELPPGVVRKFLRSKRIAWNDFATPRELLAELAKESRTELVGLQRVPHDLWAAADLPPLSLVDRLTVIAVQFDLTFEVSRDGTTVRLVPLPDDLGLVRSYPGGGDPQAVAEKYAALVPEVEIKVVGGKVYVKGLVEDHERIAAPRRPAPSPGQRPAQAVGKVRYAKVTVEAGSVEQALTDLAENLDLELKIDHKALQEAGISLDQPVSVHMEDVTVDELLLEVIKNCPIKFRRRNNVVEIGPVE